MSMSELVEWPRFHNGSIMWDEIETYDRPVGCPLCGLVVADTELHVRWHGEPAPAEVV